MFINNAFAATENAVAETGALGGTLIQLALILLIFYFSIFKFSYCRLRLRSGV